MYTTACPIRGNWGSWQDWSPCSVNCGGGRKVRIRACDNPTPANNGPDCCGSGTESRRCAPNPCPKKYETSICDNDGMQLYHFVTFCRNGDWGDWMAWSSCFGSCSNGRQRRRRTCDNPAPANNGRDCSGTGSQSRWCKPLRCPINGLLALEAVVMVANVEEEWMGSVGTDSERISCKPIGCPINGNWGEWMAWSSCSGSCSSASNFKKRACDKPAPANNGLACSGSGIERTICKPLGCLQAKQIRFVREGDTGHATKSQQHFILDKGSEWNIRTDIGKKLVFPECVQTTLRPYIVVWLQTSKMVVAIELTVPWEERCEEAYQRKKEKYTELMTTCRERGWKAWLFQVDVGCRGFPAQSVWRMLQAMGIVGKARKTVVRQLGEAAERSSCWLWHRRDYLSWKPSADE
ncbi:unnamed protein product [Mytilus coruscus]|uniref:Hemicentin-1 n=1 Tax=Mytilus coruscus TaxID=42192 RepID=A0A6J8ENY6_MYTCO|nr:unnamed protein product [Mytilus coruscus]